MKQIGEFVDERLKSWCIHCGGWIEELETNVDHVPSKVLLLKPYPPNLPVVGVHKACNRGFSMDEDYLFTFLSAVLAGSTEPEDQGTPRAMRALKRNPRLRARIENSRHEYETADGEKRCMWTPEADRINRIIVKNARGHAFYEHGEPMVEEPVHVMLGAIQLLSSEQRLAFENVDLGIGWPEVGSRMMTRMMTGQDFEDGWVTVQDGVYRYAVLPTCGTVVRAVLFDYVVTEVAWDT